MYEKVLWIFKRTNGKYNWFRDIYITVNKWRTKFISRCKVCYICGKRIPKKIAKDKNYRKVRYHCHYTGKYRDAAHSTCNSKFNVPNEIPVVFHKGSNDDYHFIIKDLASDVEWKFECLGENKKNYKTFSVLIEKEIIKVDKDGNETIDNTSYKIKFIDSARFTASSLSNLLDNFREGILKINCKDYDCSLEYKSAKDHVVKSKCLSFNKGYSNKLGEVLRKKFKNAFKFFNNDINKLILLL